MATSGTSGDPKGVVLTHDAVRASALATSARLGVDPGRDRWVACLPLAHIGGLAVVTRSLLTGTPVTVLDGFDAEEVERQAGLGATLVSLVATALDRTDASRLPHRGAGWRLTPGHAPRQRRHHLWLDRDRLRRRLRRAADRRRGGADRRRAPGRAGEVLVRGPMLLRSYRDGTDPKLTGGWLPTGDGGRMTADGTLAVFGRMAEVIVTGGEKVWPVTRRADPVRSPRHRPGGGVEATRPGVG